MIGDLLLKLHKFVVETFCIHNYKYKDLDGGHDFWYCTKCRRVKKNL